MPPTTLPFKVKRRLSQRNGNTWVATRLASLGYPGYAYLKRATAPNNPAEVLLRALAMNPLEQRLTEAMPWFLLRFSGFDQERLVKAARELNVQNRLGFVVSLAKAVAKSNPGYADRVPELARLESALEPYRLAREDDLGQTIRSQRLRAWVRKNRSEAAVHWNVLTDLSSEHLAYGNWASGRAAGSPARP